MQVVRFERCGPPRDVLSVVELPVPDPSPGEVRVRMLASPINPSDLMFIEGKYGQRPALPATPGFEGVGVVESSGRGLLGRWLTGRRVAVLNRSGGNWAEQVVLPAKQVIPLTGDLSLEQAATFFVNPTTAVAMTERILRLQRGEWLLQSAAASSLGRMIVRLGRQNGFRTMNVVRRATHVDELKALGADEVVIFDEASDSTERLVAHVRQQTGGVRCAIDPVGGRTGAALAECLTQGGRLLVYGSLSEQPIPVHPRTLITLRISVEGFWLGPWMLNLSLPAKLKLIRRVSRLIKQGVLTTHVGDWFPLSEIRTAITTATEPGRTGKVLLRIESNHRA